MFKANGIITFTTDFGLRDPYAGIMKGIALGINPNVKIVDITHDIPAHDILNASFTLAASYKFFPEGTIHTAIVDPGVGSSRKSIAIITENYVFIGPDNGIFSIIANKEKVCEIREIQNPPFVSDTISSTFHGRDIFAPCAAYLSTGRYFTDIGPVIKNISKINYPRTSKTTTVLTGEIVAVDSFGNLVSNISEKNFKAFVANNKFEIYFSSERFTKIENHYDDVPVGAPLILFGSSGYLEISMNSGSAHSYFMVPIGTTVSVRRS